MAFLAVMAFNPATVLAQTTDQADKNIVQLASENSDLGTLVAALKAADLVSTLEGDGPYTVFAPTDAAFRALPPEVFSALLKAENRPALVEILKYHVADGKVAAADVTAGIEGASDDEPFMASTLNGDFTANLMDGSVQLTDGKGNTALVTTADVMASNGVIHLIDHVLLPDNVDVDALIMNDMEVSDTMEDRLGAVEDEADDEMMEGEMAAEEMGNEMRETAKEAGNEVSETAQEMGNEARETAQAATNEVRETAREMGNEVEEAGREMANEVERAGEETSQAVQRNTTEVGNDVSREMDDMGNMTTRKTTYGNTIVDVASGNEDFSTLVTAVQAAELGDLLGSDTEFTVFAPTNDAFDKLPEGTVSDLTQSSNKEKLQGILSYHVVASRITAADLMKAIEANKGYFRIQTLGGGSLIASMQDGNVILTDGNGEMATITATDVAASNGLIHSIDGVLMPKE